jgi:hypothetical protein
MVGHVRTTAQVDLNDVFRLVVIDGLQDQGKQGFRGWSLGWLLARADRQAGGRIGMRQDRVLLSARGS